MNLNPSRWTGLWGKFWLVLLAPLFVLIALVSLPLVILLQAVDHARLRLYCWRHNRWTFLIAHKRRGWLEFIGNNVAPVTPADVTIVWPDVMKSRENILYLLFTAASGQGKPCLVHVGMFRLRVRSIHGRLQSGKSQRRVDPALQERIAFILREELAQLRAS